MSKGTELLEKVVEHYRKQLCMYCVNRDKCSNVKDECKVEELVGYMKQLEKGLDGIYLDYQDLGRAYYNSVDKKEVIKLKEKIHSILGTNGITRAYQLKIDECFDELLKEE